MCAIQSLKVNGFVQKGEESRLEEQGFFESSEGELWVCEVCGHVHRGKKAPKVCPLCKAPQEYFRREHLD